MRGFLCLAAAAMAPLAVGEQSIATVETEGFSSGQGLAARTRALSAAERDAVLLYVTGLLERPDVGNARPVVDAYKTYVESSRIVAEEAVDGGLRVRAQVYLDELDLRREVARLIFPSLPTQPVVALLIAEEIPEERYLSVGDVGIVEDALAQAYIGSGFLVLPPALLRERYTQDDLLARALGELAGAARFAVENQAYVIAVGQARVSSVPVNTSGSVVSATAILTVHVLNGRTARIYDAIHAEATVNGATPAEAGRAALLDASAKIVQRAVVAGVLAMTSVTLENSISLTVLEGTDRSRMMTLRQSMQSVPGVTGVDLLRVSAEGSLFTLRYEGAIKELVDGLSALDAGGAHLTPQQVVGEEMVFRLSSG